jgi:hypothetical protein
VPIELKTKKLSKKSQINISDLGQCFNHLEWLKNSHPDVNVLGMLIVSDTTSLSDEAKPSDQMWVSDLGGFKMVYDEAMGMLRALQRMTPLDRYAEINALCVRPEWQLDAIFTKVRGKKALTLK